VRLIGYLKKALGKGLLYSNCGYTRVAVFSDADWTSSPIDKWSATTIGYCVFLGGKFA